MTQDIPELRAQADLFNILVGVAANQGTFESLCADLAGTPNSQMIRGYGNDQLCAEEAPELEQQLNAAVAARRHAAGIARPRKWPSTTMTGLPMGKESRNKCCGCGAKPKTGQRAFTG